MPRLRPIRDLAGELHANSSALCRCTSLDRVQMQHLCFQRPSSSPRICTFPSHLNSNRFNAGTSAAAISFCFCTSTTWGGGPARHQFGGAARRHFGGPARRSLVAAATHGEGVAILRLRYATYGNSSPSARRCTAASLQPLCFLCFVQVPSAQPIWYQSFEQHNRGGGGAICSSWSKILALSLRPRHSPLARLLRPERSRGVTPSRKHFGSLQHLRA